MKVRYEFNPFDLIGKKVKGKNRKQALSEIASFVHESILRDVGSQVSPVYGKKFQKLNKDYRDFKRSEGGSGVPDLELSGEMLDSLKVYVEGNRVITEITGEQAPKADGHNNHSGKSKLPLRRFIPKKEDGETFQPAINEGIKEILDSFED